MRMGQEDEPKRRLEMSYSSGYRDAATVNSLRLLDELQEFCDLQGRCHQFSSAAEVKEAELLYPWPGSRAGSAT